jgi:hypothetical protein
MSFDFLRNLTLVDTKRRRKPVSNNPTGTSIRILKSGAVYPSRELVDALNLEYPRKVTTEEQQNAGFGFDVIDSVEWEPTKNLPRMIFLAQVTKAAPKVDLFGLARYENGVPKVSVMEQGSLNPELLQLVRDLGYMSEEQSYCDLVLDLTHPIPLQDDLAWLPKTIEKGPRAGERDYERRENIKIYGAVCPDVQVSSTTVVSEHVTQNA